ncbi:CWF19-like protein 2 [Dichanthelium oligosanthes]|uniref:CWF19-like protein 2 n=1 Tax=Dichanthelium oligosanthes TaxID=888268 RepID=A0A1E5VAK9_9POAL|nr:CWF19-like protein 2 [Dichanthelium oligosanthes]
MLSGVKLVPRDQISSQNRGGGGGGFDSDSSDGKRRGKRSKSGRGRDKEDRRRSRRRRSKKFSSDEKSVSETDDSIGEEEEEEVSRSKRRGKHRRRRHNFSDDDSESSESDRGRARGNGKQRGDDEDDDEEEEDAGGEGLRASEVVRREMGLEWMLKSASSSRAEGSSLRKADDEKDEAAHEEVARPDPKELNPYLKDNGTGYPEESTPSNAGNQLLGSAVVGDGGASWRLKALKRAKEQAAREGRKLEEVVEERWGSLGDLAVSVSASRAAHSRAHLHAIRGRKSVNADNSEEHAKENSEGHQGGGSGRRDYLRDVSSQHHAMRKPKPDSVPWKRRRQDMSAEDQALISSAVASLNKFSDDGSFMEKISNLNKNTNASTSSASASADEHRDNDQKNFKESSKKAPLVSTQKLNANQLAAKILQLRMKGKNEEAEQLSREMEALLENQDTVSEEPSHGKERGSIRHTLKPSAADRRRREENADLHLANKIMHNKQYNISKSIEDEYDFGDAPTKKDKRKNKEAHEERRSSNRPMLTQKERCLYCFENPSRPKHLIVAIGNFTYLMLPQFEPVVPGHCLILPLQHESATRTVDQNVWGEIRNFKKCLLKMFAQQDRDVVFMETVISLARQRRHCMIECIPVPCDVSSNAPMYFKKAIDEAEEEWTQHEMKKVIPTSASRNLRQAIPENFAYFHVEFGLDRGFVHVIDDESKFSAGFGLNIIRGMLQLPEEDMHRRRRHESMDNQKQAVASFMKDWEPFDWTKQLD